jgi:chromosome condensin MukBEF MukE localization factor
MPLKSAWELALERTGGASATKLTDAQKKKLAELDKLYTAKIAQEELTLKPKIAEARDAGNDEQAQKLEDQLQTMLGRLRRKLESEKEAVRKAS